MIDQSKTIGELAKMNPELRLMHVLHDGVLTSRKLINMGMWNCYTCGTVNDFVNSCCAKCKEERFFVCEDLIEAVPLKKEVEEVAEKNICATIFTSIRQSEFDRIRRGHQKQLVRVVDFRSVHVFEKSKYDFLTLQTRSHRKVRVNILDINKERRGKKNYFVVDIELRNS